MAELSGQGPVIFSGATSIVDVNSATVPAPYKLGMHGFDVDGNEYVYVDFQQALLAGEWVVFNQSYAATRITGASTSASLMGWVGVVIGTVSASDRAGWVQVRGIHTAAWATSDATTNGIPVVYATTDQGGISTAATSGQGTVLYGVHICTDPDTCASTALSTSATLAPCTVMLNYPFITGDKLDPTT